MSNPQIQLTGPKAIIVLVIIVGFGLFRMVSAREALTTEGREVLEDWIAGEVIRPMLADSTMALEDKGSMILQASEVEIVDMKGRGPLDDMVVKVELAPNEAFPPDMKLVRYYRLTYSTITGWRHRGNATVVSYILAHF